MILKPLSIEMNENLSYHHNTYLDGLRRIMKLVKITGLLHKKHGCKSVYRGSQSSVFVGASLHQLDGFVKILVGSMEWISASPLYLELHEYVGGQPAEVKRPECGSSPPSCSDCAGRFPWRFFTCTTYGTGFWETGRHASTFYSRGPGFKSVSGYICGFLQFLIANARVEPQITLQQLPSV
jgi:hypothetical protein